MSRVTPLLARKTASLSGTMTVPGDKSISHRAVMIAGLAVGESRIEGLLEGEDVLRTAEALRQLGATVTRHDDGTWTVQGRGVGGLSEPSDVIDMGNAGTGVRLLMGILAAHGFTTHLTGDGSLRRRPMERIMGPLRPMGAQFLAREGGLLPIAVTGSETLIPVEYALPMASAQVKSAVLLAGLHTAGETTVIEPAPTRDHTEIMLGYFGAKLTIEEREGGGRAITIEGQPELTGRALTVPGDPSSAAFPAVAALITPGSEILLPNIGLNETRTGLFTVLDRMGAQIEIRDRRTQADERVGDLQVRASALKGVDVPPEIAPSMIDEYPILAIAAALAEGTTTLRGLAELRVKESDRLSAMAVGLAACGVEVEQGEDWLTIHGTGTPPRGGATIATDLDHRIAMSFLVLGGVTEEPVSIDDGSPIDTSFPGFMELMNGAGTAIKETAS
ncbi:3-phosphoshikimate 1-carboxyvinyltransferase [Magnetospira sp. QH-2]|uniref:3-phosphoshikimate 1-carboxyvinyltransferase n=1 Tax=Magnetospira sp. (strain QH-2) TaxID=1288970 RepID=UPI0005F9FFE8|nr:3-phosphoshikimate 1-carboxyvinyltransferase [Magnetospira sp. QH-2]